MDARSRNARVRLGLACPHFGPFYQDTHKKTRPAVAGLVANLLCGTGLDNLDRRAVLLESAGQLVGLFLGEPGLDGLARGIHESLGLGQPEPGGFADDLDDLDLLVARGLE